MSTKAFSACSFRRLGFTLAIVLAGLAFWMLAQRSAGGTENAKNQHNSAILSVSGDSRALAQTSDKRQGLVESTHQTENESRTASTISQATGNADAGASWASERSTYPRNRRTLESLLLLSDRSELERCLWRNI